MPRAFIGTSGWAEKTVGWMAEGRGVCAHFDNDAHGHAAWNARTLRGMAEEG